MNENNNTRQPIQATSGLGAAMPDQDVERMLHRRTRRSFVGAAVAAAAGYGGWHWLRTRRADDGVPWPLRRILETNEQFSRDYFRSAHRAEEHLVGAAPRNPRVNGDLGLTSDIDPARWRLHVAGLAAGDGTAELQLGDITSLPRVETTMRLCCIEGWSILVNWTGARFRDFLLKYPPITQSGKPPSMDHPEDLYDYVSMETPDGSYYVGLDIASLIHPQTLLCYEIDGQPLTAEHGAPLRLVIPTKYGVKNIKRLGRIRYTGVKPTDYWAQQGYDWYAGL